MATKLLVVEDDSDIANALATYGAHRGFAVTVCDNGLDAVDVALREEPDAILLDIALPGLDGRDVLVRLQHAGVTKKSVVIFATARDAQIDRVSGLELGADDYETKPYQLATLFGKIAALVTKKRANEL
jgi:DNA-binding response OmpR family regulator